MGIERLYRALLACTFVLLAACGSDPENESEGTDENGGTDVSSGTPTASVPEPFIDETLAGYVQTYYADAAQRGVAVTPLAELRVVKWVDDFPGKSKILGGVCQHYSALSDNGKRFYWNEIHVRRAKPQYAESSSSDYRRHFRSLMYHELTHCLLSKGHSPTPGSVMYFVVNKVEDDAWSQALDDLFGDMANLPNLDRNGREQPLTR